MGLKLLIFASVITHCWLATCYGFKEMSNPHEYTHSHRMFSVYFVFIQTPINPALYTVYGTPDFSTN